MVSENKGIVVNIACKHLEFPANGDCTSGWIFHNGTDFDFDRTVILDCKGDIGSLTF